MIHAIEALMVGAFAALIAAANEAETSTAWSVVIFALGLLVGCTCVLAADRHHTRRHQREQDQANGPRGAG